MAPVRCESVGTWGIYHYASATTFVCSVSLPTAVAFLGFHKCLLPLEAIIAATEMNTNISIAVMNKNCFVDINLLFVKFAYSEKQILRTHL